MVEREEGRFAAGPRNTKAGRLIELFGGVSEMARKTGLAKATISRFDSEGRRGHHGRVPSQYNVQIIEGAVAAGIDAAVVGSLLDEHKCPCCGTALEPGQTVHIPK